MVELFENKEEFLQIINLTSEYYGMDAALIEKDYFVTLFLKKAKEAVPGLVFKGGTSLSKCYKIIDRFSEDLDLTLDTEHFTQSKKRNSVKALADVCSELGLTLANRQQIEEHTHGNFNCYVIEYPIVFASESITPGLKVEMTYIQKSYPYETVKASSYITDFLAQNGNADIIAEYGLEPFDMKVQSLERTLIDKVFALGDYYLSNSTLRTSRHIYDLSRLLTKVDLSAPAMKELVVSVRNDRKANKTCLSAQDGVDVPELLQKIVTEETFKKDYEGVTMKLLTKPVSYNEAIQAIEKVIESGIFA